MLTIHSPTQSNRLSHYIHNVTICSPIWAKTRYVFVETLFSGIRKLQAEALAREQDLQTLNAVMQERERLSRDLHDGVAQLVADLLLRLDSIKELVETNRSHEAGA